MSRVILPIMDDFHSWDEEILTSTETNSQYIEEPQMTSNPNPKHCRAEKLVDYRENRIPYRITEMVCRDLGSLCQKTGSKVSTKC